jgi:hypothetical protein
MTELVIDMKVGNMPHCRRRWRRHAKSAQTRGDAAAKLSGQQENADPWLPYAATPLVSGHTFLVSLDRLVSALL